MDKIILKEKASNSNLYKLDGRVPIHTSILFGLQHILAMFVSNVTPIIIICSEAKVNDKKLEDETISILLQNCMFIAGIASLIQIIGIWKIGSKLPIIMGISFTFLSAMRTTVNKDYNYAMFAVLIGGCIEGILGLLYKYWENILSPIVSACVVCGIGLSLFEVGTISFGGGDKEKSDFGDLKYWFIGTITLITCIIWSNFFKGTIKSLSALAGLIIGYLISIPFNLIDFSHILDRGFIAFPQPFPTGFPKFDIGSIISMTVIFLVSATETIGDSAALCQGGLNREITEEEISGSLACDGIASAISGLFGCSPITSYSQNIGLCSMTKIVNRFAIGTGAVILIISGFFPPLAGFFQTIPSCVLGGCTIMMFGQIFVSGMQMIERCGFSERNFTIIALSISIGGGFTSSPKIFKSMPEIIKHIFAENVVAVVFIVSVVLNILLPKDKGNEKEVDGKNDININIIEKT